MGYTIRVLFLGNLVLCGKEKAMQWTSRLRGTRYMIRGNHDGGSDRFYRDLGFEVVEPIRRLFTNSAGSYSTLLTHGPIQNLPEGWYNIHGHIHRGLHREYSLTPRHFNVSCEPLNYKPIPIFSILAAWKEDRA